MKILAILSIILGVFTVYFVLNAEKSILIKGGENAIPAGIDVAKFILDKAKTVEPGKIINDIFGDSNENIDAENILNSDMAREIKSKIEGIKNRVLSEGIDLVKKPIQNKAGELFCPQQ